MKHGTFRNQRDGLAIGASLAVILANPWLKQYKTALSRDIPKMFSPEKKKILTGYVPSAKRKSRTGQKVFNVNAV